MASTHALTFAWLASSVAACTGGTDLPIDCPQGSDAHELVAEDGSVERWCARPDGVLAGPYRAYDPAGVELVAGGYAEGAPEGRWEWRDASGALIRSGRYRGGVACDTWLDGGTEMELVPCATIDPASPETPAREEGDTVDGRRQGVWQSWLGDGTLVARITWADGVKAGPATTFHDNGTKACEGAYRDDLKDGAWTCWHDNEALASRQSWSLGLVDGRWETFDRAERPLSDGGYQDGVAQGTWTIWETIGYLGTLSLRAKRTGAIVDGRPQGPWTGVWEQAGSPKESEVGYVAGAREGAWTQWWPNGTVAVRGYFFDDHIHGRWTLYTDEGVLQIDQGFMFGVNDGDYAEFWEDGDPKARGRYRNGARIGLWTYWDEDGNARTESCDDWGHCS